MQTDTALAPDCGWQVCVATRLERLLAGSPGLTKRRVLRRGCWDAFTDSTGGMQFYAVQAFQTGRKSDAGNMSPISTLVNVGLRTSIVLSDLQLQVGSCSAHSPSLAAGGRPGPQASPRLRRMPGAGVHAQAPALPRMTMADQGIHGDMTRMTSG